MKNRNSDSCAQATEKESEENGNTWVQTIEEEGNAVVPQLGPIPSWEPSEEPPGHNIMPCDK
jgi:hypothetical protein